MNIAEQLRAFCECVEDISDGDIAEMINVVSLMTGWQKDGCETFLTGARREVRDLPSCADCPITFEPYYHPFDETSFRFYLVKIKGLDEDITEITDFRYSTVDHVFRIATGLPSCRCGCDPCGCKAEYRLVAEYDAGYDELPECILPVFCHLLEVIKARKNCDCEDCGCDTEPKVKYASGDVVSVALETDLGKLLVEQYKAQLLTLALHEVPVLWGFVV